MPWPKRPPTDSDLPSGSRRSKALQPRPVTRIRGFRRHNEAGVCPETRWANSGVGRRARATLPEVLRSVITSGTRSAEDVTARGPVATQSGPRYAVANRSGGPVASRRDAYALSQRGERLPGAPPRTVGFLPGGEVAALVGLVEVGGGGVAVLDPAARGPKISPGNVVKPTGNGPPEEPGRTRRLSRACPSSQYERAAETPVPVSQYIVMLSRMWSRVRLPAGSSSTKAREIL